MFDMTDVTTPDMVQAATRQYRLDILRCQLLQMLTEYLADEEANEAGADAAYELLSSQAPAVKQWFALAQMHLHHNLLRMTELDRPKASANANDVQHREADINLVEEQLAYECLQDREGIMEAIRAATTLLEQYDLGQYSNRLLFACSLVTDGILSQYSDEELYERLGNVVYSWAPKPSNN